MNTKIVYVVSSNNNDYYFEQVWASAFSLKYYNPESQVFVVTDRDTYNNIMDSYRRLSLNYIDEIIPIDICSTFTNMQKSRWLKTNLRNVIDGDFLFIDSDTLITGDLSEIDNLQCNIGMVLDYHVLFNANWNSYREISAAKRIFDRDCSNVEKYFNSGVIFCKDNEVTHNFYSQWNELWKEGNTRGYTFDQLSLMITCIDNPDICEEISGIYNCQITVGLGYLLDAKIVHFFSSTTTSFTPFKCKETYMQIKIDGTINERLQNQIINCKRCFNGPIYIMTSNDHDERTMPLYKLYAGLYRRRDKWYVKLLSKIVSCIIS